MILSGKQKRYLRALDSKEKAIIMIGKENISDTLIESVQHAFNTHELLKVSLLKSCEITVHEAAIELSAATGAAIVQEIGHTLLLYKPFKERAIKLP